MDMYPPPLSPPIYRLSFDAWVDACWNATLYRDAYLEDFGLDDARYAAASNGLGEREAQQAYHSQLLAQPRSMPLLLAVYDQLSAPIQARALDHFLHLQDDLNWRNTVEAQLAAGLALWARRDQLRDAAQRVPVLLFRTSSTATLPLSSTVSVPFRRAGGSPTARVVGSVLTIDGQVWIESRFPDSASRSAHRFLLVEAYAYARPGERPERPEPELRETCAFAPEDLFEIDERPTSVYYVTARRGASASSLLLGPFASHLDAVCHVAIARTYATQRPLESDAPDLATSIGTARLERGAVLLPTGIVNVQLLSKHAQLRVDAALDAGSLERHRAAVSGAA